MNDGFNKALQICNFRCWYFVLRCLVVCYTCKFSLFPHLWSLWRECKSVRHDEIIFFLLKIHLYSIKILQSNCWMMWIKLFFSPFISFLRIEVFLEQFVCLFTKKYFLYFLLLNVKNGKGLDDFGFNSFSLVFWERQKELGKFKWWLILISNAISWESSV